MIRREGDLHAEDGTRLHWRAWSPENGSKGTILLAHGYNEHGDRYGPFVERVVPEGWAVHAMDHRGHGLSEGRRGHVDRWSRYVEDLDRFRSKVVEPESSGPLFLLGHSMGGLIAVSYVLERGDHGLSGLVLSSPGLGVRVEPPTFLAWIGGLLSIVAPTTTFSSDIDASVLSHDPAVGTAYEADPLVHGKATARFWTELGSAMAEALANAPKISLPVLALQAGDDRLVDPAATRRFVESCSGDATVLEYPGLFHEMFLEKDPDRVYADLIAWLDRIGP